MDSLLKSQNINTFIMGCHDDACVEPSKKYVGWGTYIGAMAEESVKNGKSRYFSAYKCDKFDKCQGKCGVYNPE